VKLKDMVHFSELRPRTGERDGPVVTKSVNEIRPNVLEIIEVINHEPGLGVNEIAKRAGIVFLNSEQWHLAVTRIAGQLGSHLKGKNPHVKRVKQDGAYRYYPVNYRLTSDEMPTSDEMLEGQITLKRIIAETTAHPGATVTDLVGYLGVSEVHNASTRIAARLVAHLNSRHPRIYRRKSSKGRYTYYPITTTAPVESAPVVEAPTEPAVVGPVPDTFGNELEAVLKDYVWSTGALSDPLRELLQWYKEQDRDQPHTK
jgi:hypothetical protein